MHALSVVIPVYDEVPRLDAGLAGLRELRAVWPGPVRALFVDDGSRDGTADALASRLPALAALWHDERVLGHGVPPR